MKKYLFGILAVLVLVLGVTANPGFAAEAPVPSNATGVGPFEGVFYGIVSGDNNSRAPLALLMTHRDGVVNGRMYLGDGLFVNAGVCGKTEIPPMVQSASGKTLGDNPNKMVVDTKVNFSGIDIGVDLTSTVSEDGKTLNATTSIDLPWICGRDPSYSGTLYRIQ